MRRNRRPWLRIVVPPMTTNFARGIAGGGIFLLTVMVFVMMWVAPELANNDLFKSLAQAIVIQGLIGLAMAFLFTGKNSDGGGDKGDK